MNAAILPPRRQDAKGDETASPASALRLGDLAVEPCAQNSAESEAQIVSLRAELAGCADAGQAMELLRLVVDAMEAMEKPLAFLNALTNGAHGPVMGQLAFFLGTGMGNFRGVRDALRAARRRAALALNEEPPRHQDAKEEGR